MYSLTAKMIRFFNVLANLLLAIFLTACTSLPERPLLPVENSLPPAKNGFVSKLSRKLTADLPPEHSAYQLLTSNMDALQSRLAAIDLATSSIDMQYFIWRGDEAGTLVFQRVLQAADRGVRVRLLVDDLLVPGLEEDLAAASQHPNLEIRVFNPASSRNMAGMISQYLFDLNKLNRRMHNKLFIVDNQFAIVGGRNIGNEYFGLKKKYNFLDLDVLAIGSVVTEISVAFDNYWNNEDAYPASLMDSNEDPGGFEALRDDIDAYIRQKRKRLASYLDACWRPDEYLERLLENVSTGEGHFLQDNPQQPVENGIRLIDMLYIVAQPAHRELIMVSPYFIPVENTLDDLKKLHEEGVDIYLLTNSLASNDHTMVHSHYKKYREQILHTGARLYEFNHQPGKRLREDADAPPVHADFISLHTKALVGDRQRCFIGSMNLDPRALEINYENGLYIKSSHLAAKLTDYLENVIQPGNAWEIVHDENKEELLWKSGDDTLSEVPARSFWQRIGDFLFQLLPVENQL